MSKAERNCTVEICSNLCKGENIKQQQNIVSKYGEAKILKEYLKGEVENFEDFN